jgi:hypothetical protein
MITITIIDIAISQTTDGSSTARNFGVEYVECWPNQLVAYHEELTKDKKVLSKTHWWPAIRGSIKDTSPKLYSSDCQDNGDWKGNLSSSNVKPGEALPPPIAEMAKKKKNYVSGENSSIKPGQKTVFLLILKARNVISRNDYLPVILLEVICNEPRRI